MAEMQDSRFNVLVVGAGYTGLAMARALSLKLGPQLTVGLLDRQPWDTTPAADPRASALSAGAVNALTQLGVWPRLEQDAQPVERIDITDPIGDSPLRQIMLQYDNMIDGAAASWIVENKHLKAALHDTVFSDPAITRCDPGTVRNFSADSSAATIVLEDGRQLRADLVIAADGGNSKLRQLTGIKTTGWPYSQTGIVTTVGHTKPHNATATQHFLPAGPFAILPLKNNCASIVWTEDAEVAKGIMEADDATFLATLEDRFGTRLGKLSLEGPRASWPLRLNLARELTDTRLALVGEAARTVHPIAGQGLNLAIRDIAALADTIAESVALGIDPGNAETLEQYARWRRFDGGTSALVFDAINRLFSNGNPLVRSVRDAGLELVGRSDALKNFFVREAAGLTGDAVPSLMMPVEASAKPSSAPQEERVEI